MARFRPILALAMLAIAGFANFSDELRADTLMTRTLEDSYPDQMPGELRLNYYYDRTGRWVKFSDWIPYQQNKHVLRHFEDFYQAFGLPHHYNVAELKEAIYFLVMAMTHRFRHPRYALCTVQTEDQYHKYRLLMFMKANLLIMRMYLRLGSMYDKRHLYFYDLDFADDLEISFLIARTYYREAIKYWRQAVEYANQADDYRFTLGIHGIENERHLIKTGELNYGRIIERHLYQVEAKLGVTSEFLDEEGRPRPVKEEMQREMEAFHDQNVPEGSPLNPPELDIEQAERPLFPELERPQERTVIPEGSNPVRAAREARGVAP